MNYKDSIEFFKENTFQADSDEQEKSLRARYFQRLILKEILIRYTAGNEIVVLIPLLEKLVEALEAGAIAFLYGIEDSKINHRVYPKGLVEYARNYQPTDTAQIARINAGQPCSKAGYWFTPAQAESRRYFEQGEIMPSFSDSRWGDTIWYWSGEE
ncbi:MULTISPECIES: DUF1910 domain-containing protein [Pseudomonas]|uniref:DUF1910 domain-containing protein n=1 Tax=Pseudomonas TaxID=286 RepID=UPI0009D9F156|nr:MULTISPECIES: DUF1910 domain-containing protein [Pseudomonas]